MFAQGFGSNGGSMAIDVPLSNDFSVSGGYLTDRTLELAPDVPPSGLGHFRTGRAQSVSIAFTGRVAKSGTRVSASYRWQPATTISTLAPYETAGSSPYLCVHIRQPLHATKVSPTMELTLDGDNLLQEGYRKLRPRAAGGISSECLAGTSCWIKLYVLKQFATCSARRRSRQFFYFPASAFTLWFRRGLIVRSAPLLLRRYGFH